MDLGDVNVIIEIVLCFVLQPLQLSEEVTG